MPAPPRLEQAVIDLAFSRQEAVLSNPSILLSDAVESGLETDTASILAVPLVNERESTGLLYPRTSDPSTLFDHLHLELGTAIAGSGSVALHNVSRFENLEAETERLKKVLNIAHEMKGGSPAMQRVYRTVANSPSSHGVDLGRPRQTALRKWPDTRHTR